MPMISPDLIAHYHAELSSQVPQALKAIELLEACEGDLEDAAIALALREGQEPDQSDRWLEGFAKRWRAYICQSGLRQQLAAGPIANGVQLLAGEMAVSSGLAALALIYVQTIGVEAFCRPMDERL